MIAKLYTINENKDKLTLSIKNETITETKTFIKGKEIPENKFTIAYPLCFEQIGIINIDDVNIPKEVIDKIKSYSYKEEFIEVGFNINKTIINKPTSKSKYK